MQKVKKRKLPLLIEVMTDPEAHPALSLLLRWTVRHDEIARAESQWSPEARQVTDRRLHDIYSVLATRSRFLGRQKARRRPRCLSFEAEIISNQLLVGCCDVRNPGEVADFFAMSKPCGRPLRYWVYCAGISPKATDGVAKRDLPRLTWTSGMMSWT